MSNNIHNANFWELLTRYPIEIPIIQRDYVQGREENRKIRKKIVSKFKEASHGEPTKLDFIYGNIRNNVFYPLDGQQRLTTLFLYYLYFALRDDELKDLKVKQQFAKFTYSTRVSSKEFFKKLLDANITIDVKTDLSEEISNQNWFITYWKNDPTVASALGMLNEIHNQCFESKFDFNDIIKKENKDITFEFLELEKFGLSDDLYIKMNARGKVLSTYENFKADLIGHIKRNDWEAEKNYQERFSTNIDGNWTDYFWDEGKNSKMFDSFSINFFHQFLITEVATRSELSDYIIQTYFEVEDDKSTNEKKISIDELLAQILANADDISETYLDKQSINTLHQLLERYSSVSRTLKTNTNLWINEFTNIDNLLVTGRITYPNRVFHFAHSCYLLKNAYHNNEDYSKWMRIVRNIISNSTIDTVDTFRGALQLINEVSEGSSNIYEFLSDYKMKSRFAEKQVTEEIQKSKLLIEKLLSYEDLVKIEDTRLCFGRIEFVLHFIENNANGDYSKVIEIANIFINYFESNDFTNEIRALFLTCGDGKFYDYWTSWVYVVDLPKRCLIEHTSDLRNYSYNSAYRKYFSEVLEKLLFSGDIKNHLDIFSNSNAYPLIPLWKQKIIRNYKILDKHCKSKMIAIAGDDSKCYVMNIGKPRSKDSLKKLV
ncbi:DUF262 domain-containing protein [Chryseobacterium sp. OV279]|uniref:GmrSD restriction endonuclease domain-containing protein n=1 Tax=Chryseobacterium sp. OV279 TaxID=1500285 RepID=UPI00092461DD|nr:DUF262 domain-containing protein [Chryseobacterium sp. OV279]SHE93488.1 Uncharacterized conserved protein, contains ParB-like and HNH nuclease domains [Chryseobacterium sp. OV279]